MRYTKPVMAGVVVLALQPALPAAAFSLFRGPSAVLVYELESVGNPEVDRKRTEDAVATLKRRLEAFQVDAKVEESGSGRIAVTLDGSHDDPEGVLRPLLKPARLEFRLVVAGKAEPGSKEIAAVEYSLDPETKAVVSKTLVLEKKVLLTGADLRSARAGYDARTGEPIVSLAFGPDGKKKLAAATWAAVGRKMAIMLDGRVMSARTITGPIEGGEMMLAGDFTTHEAVEAAKMLSSGPLPDGLTLATKIIGGQHMPVAPPATTPAERVAAAARPAPRAPEKVSDVDAAPPAVRGRADAVAVVIGVERTRQGLPPADYAARDARVFADYLTKTLGYPEENVALLLDDHAAKSDFEKYLEDWLPRKAGPGSTVLVYFSGHGSPDAARGTAYLVPYDGDPAFLAKTAFPLTRLYDDLGRLKGRRTIVLLDACFSGAGRRSALAKGARPLVTRLAPAQTPPEAAVLSAAASDQIGGSFDAQGHGLFTYYVLRALKDAAARGRVPTLQQLYESVAGKVEAEARRLTGDQQTPELRAPDAARQGTL